MAFLTIGIILIIVGAALRRTQDAINRLGRPIMAGGIAIAIIGLLFSAMVQIEAGQIGIKTLFGRVQPDILNSGLHLVNPLVVVTKADARTQNFTMSGQHDES